jgi:putative phosphoribosyl transferase
MRYDKKLFKNTDDAAKQLIDKLPLDLMRHEPWIVIASTIRGVRIAKQIAKELDGIFDFIFTQKIYAPRNDECEIAIVTETNEIIIRQELKEAFDIQLDYIYDQAKEKFNSNIKDDIKKYRGDKKRINLKDKNVLFVDNGINTGLTMIACIKSAINCEVRSVAVATPVLSRTTIQDLQVLIDDLYFVEAPLHFLAIDYYYEELERVNLDEIKKIINKE